MFCYFCLTSIDGIPQDWPKLRPVHNRDQEIIGQDGQVEEDPRQILNPSWFRSTLQILDIIVAVMASKLEFTLDKYI